MTVITNEATKIVEPGACKLADIDTAIIHATGNPAGLIAIARKIEPDALAARLQALTERFSKEIIKPARIIRERRYR